MVHKLGGVLDNQMSQPNLHSRKFAASSCGCKSDKHLVDYSMGVKGERMSLAAHSTDNLVTHASKAILVESKPSEQCFVMVQAASRTEQLLQSYGDI